MMYLPKPKPPQTPDYPGLDQQLLGMMPGNGNDFPTSPGAPPQPIDDSFIPGQRSPNTGVNGGSSLPYPVTTTGLNRTQSAQAPTGGDPTQAPPPGSPADSTPGTVPANAPDPYTPPPTPAPTTPSTGGGVFNPTPGPGNVPVVPGQALPGTPGATGPGLPPGYVPRDPATGQPIPYSGQPGTGGTVDPTVWTNATADLGVGSDTDHTALNTLMERLQKAGYQVRPGPTDAQGRQDSLIINGILTRVFDSNGKWTPVQDFNGSAWGSASSSSGGGVQPPNAQLDPSIEAAIQRLLARGEAPVSASDPNIAGPTAAFKAQADTAQRRARVTLAERAASEGLNSGGAGSGFFDSALQSQQEQEGRDVGSEQSGLMVNEIQARRQDVINALNFATGDERFALQQQLAYYNSQLQNQQFYDTMSYNMGRDNNSIDAQLLALIRQLEGG